MTRWLSTADLLLLDVLGSCYSWSEVVTYVCPLRLNRDFIVAFWLGRDLIHGLCILLGRDLPDMWTMYHVGP